MYLKIGPQVHNDDFSWIISKNPGGAPYERQVGGPATGRRVVGKFLPYGAYEIVIHNDGLLFFNMMRERNEAAYVRPEPWIVCPANLQGLSTAFRSALHGAVGKDITPERFNAPMHLWAKVGPFPERVWVAFFEALGLKAEALEEGTKEAHTMILTTIEPMSVTTFLQKIYISMMSLTSKWAFYDKIEDAQVDKYLALTKTWLPSVAEPFNHIIVQRLTGYRKNLQARFAAPASEAAPEQVDGSAEKDDKETEIGKKISLHEKRHQLILDNMPQWTELMAMKVVDLGAGEGKLFAGLHERFPVATLIGIEASRERLWRLKRKLKRGAEPIDRGQVTLYHDNLLFPRNWAELVEADVLIASEVIEHMRLGDRTHFIRLIAELLEPKIIMLTTPNVEANEPMFGMSPGTLRHDDHKIEYTRAQFEAEVVKPLSVYYDVTFLDVLPGEPIQPSFCIKAVRRSDAGSSNGKGYLAYGIRRMGEPSYFPMTDVTVSAKDMREGYTTHAFLENSRSIFYLGPTIAPVDYVSELDQYLLGASAGGPYLEHPIAAFQYYLARGQHILVEEPKYMGSRGYLLIFRDPDQARSFGFEQPIVVNARSGGSFFKDESQLMAIWQDIAPKLQDDWIILDAEILPWILKAERLIARDFLLPGEAALLWRQRNQPELVDNTKRYLKMVKLYGEDKPLEIRAFHILARGKVKRGKYKMLFDEPRYGFYRTHVEQLREIAELEGDIIKPAGHQLINLGSEEARSRSVQRWLEYCESGGEGFVYKPLNFLTHSVSGYPIQAAVKVRGKDYLRIIYGMDYLQDQYFDRLKARGTKMKRLLAVQEQEIAVQILRTFINSNEVERLRAIGAFMGLEWAQAGTIDKTL